MICYVIFQLGLDMVKIVTSIEDYGFHIWQDKVRKLSSGQTPDNNSGNVGSSVIRGDRVSLPLMIFIDKFAHSFHVKKITF